MNDHKYAVPISGYYLVSAKTYTHIPTGKFETVKNPRRKFWQFWKPKIVTREIYETKVTLDSRQIVHAKAGDVFAGIPPKRVK